MSASALSAPRNRASSRHRQRQEDGADKRRQHLRLIENQVRALLVAPANGMGDQRGGADAQHLRRRQHDEQQVAADADSRNGLGPEPSHPVEVHQHVQRLKQHRHQHVAGGLQQMSR